MYKPFHRGPLALSYDPLYVAPTTSTETGTTARPRRRRRPGEAGSSDPAREADAESVNRPAAVPAGAATLVLVVATCLIAWQEGSPLVPRNGGVVVGAAPWFLVLLLAAFTTYVVALLAIRAAGHRRRVRSS